MVIMCTVKIVQQNMHTIPSTHWRSTSWFSVISHCVAIIGHDIDVIQYHGTNEQ